VVPKGIAVRVRSRALAEYAARSASSSGKCL
jgi:hypothetical protein